jgi:hypothetical protein
MKWARFTCTGKETKSITKLFKISVVKISYTTHNTIARLLNEKFKPNENKFEGSGVYQLTCPDCNMKYIGQTDRYSRTRFSEHFRDFKYSTQKSRFAQHLLEYGHAIGPIENIMEIIHPTTKGR